MQTTNGAHKQIDTDGLTVRPVGATKAPVEVSKAAVAAATGTPPVADPFSVRLSKSYQNQDEMVSVVRFREPTGKDYRKYGAPRRYVVIEQGLKSETSIEINTEKVASYIQCLSDPPLLSSTVDKFTISDFAACSEVIFGFFN
jgi:hypothetical protein